MVNFGWWQASPCSHHSLNQASLILGVAVILLPHHYHHPEIERPCSILAGGGLLLTPATTITPKIDHSCSILGVVVPLALATTTNLKSSICARFRVVVGFFFLLPLPPP